ncbi:MAG: modification methylase [Cyanobacteria bacterium QS_8_64_29]|nr:MAG: modification methylase [Cyanobacteria bacterium QS_8_64_29]
MPTYQSAKPFLKWAGGKGQLLAYIDRRLPAELANGAIARYVEPFVGSGAVFLHVAQHYPVAEFFLADRSAELALAYTAVREAVEPLIERLAQIQAHYERLAEPERRTYFYQVRAAFNRASPTSADRIERAAQLIFLNRTCFNGLFRVNARGEFNVPFGRYARPRICDAANLRAVAQLLQRARIGWGDFTHCEPAIDGQTLVYLDPPYRPIGKTARFNAYAPAAFDDAEQLRLRDWFARLDAKGAKLLLSNADPRNADPDDAFFDAAYRGYWIERVAATRAINSKPDRRGAINELLIANYPPADGGERSMVPPPSRQSPS